MNLEPLVPWLAFAALIISLGTSITSFFTSGAKATAKTVTEHDTRITKLEGKIENLPDQSTTHSLEIAMERLTGKIEVLEERLKPVDLLSRRLNEVMINRAEGK